MKSRSLLKSSRRHERANLSIVPATSRQSSSKPKTYATRAQSGGRIGSDGTDSHMSSETCSEVRSFDPIASVSTPSPPSPNSILRISAESPSSSSINLKSTFKCNRAGCHKSFNRKGNLKLHYENVHSDKSYPCDAKECTIVCKSLKYLRQHIIDKHSGKLRPTFKCNQVGCDYSCNRKGNLHLHIERKHLNTRNAFNFQPSKKTSSRSSKQNLQKHTPTLISTISTIVSNEPLTNDPVTEKGKHVQLSEIDGPNDQGQLPNKDGQLSLNKLIPNEKGDKQNFNKIDSDNSKMDLTKPLQVDSNLSNCVSSRSNHTIGTSNINQSTGWGRLFQKICNFRPKNHNAQDRAIPQLSNIQKFAQIRMQLHESSKIDGLISDEQSLDGSTNQTNQTNQKY